MAECNIKKEINKVFTGDDDVKRHLCLQLKQSIQKAEAIDLIVSFLMKSGVSLIINDLKEATKRGVKIRILTGNYLNITEPSALTILKTELGNNLELHFYDDETRSFHPKSYIFHYEDYNEIYVGSSNMSKSALTSGIEWNYMFTDLDDKNSYDEFYATFEKLFNYRSYLIDDNKIKEYIKTYRKPTILKDIEKLEKISKEQLEIPEPHEIQLEALYSLEQTRLEGASKALIHAATGVGKTYLAAFDSQKYQHVLFVAHREEILLQAYNSFQNVRKHATYGFFTGKIKDTSKDIIFSSIETLSKKEYLNEKYFSPTYFDYIIIDEFHHAASNGYLRLINYFKPKFMLGLTATPERLDRKDIYELCDYNVPYEINLYNAINRGILCPFHYYGIYDNTDYEQVNIINGHYNQTELTKLYLKNKERHDLIYKYYQKYHRKRALAFCCSKKHAYDMANFFNKKGHKVCTVYSASNNDIDEFALDRKEAIEKLKKQEIEIIFAVDMFNEGLDITELDLVMFLRPTESPVIFLQQLGRGLRLSDEKEYLNVLDFIGNYNKANLIPKIFSQNDQPILASSATIQQISLPDGCMIDFDIKLIDLFKELENKKQPIKNRIKQEYFRIKEQLNNKVPTRMELFTLMDDEIYNFCINYSSFNIFKNYLAFLNEIGEATKENQELINNFGGEFIHHIEQTSMTKVYKMIILKAIYNDGNILKDLDEQQALKVWKEFFNDGINWKDFDEDKTYNQYQHITDSDHLKKIKNYPIKYLLKSESKLLVKKDNYLISLTDELIPYLNNPTFKEHFKDIIDYRIMEYYRKKHYLEN